MNVHLCYCHGKLGFRTMLIQPMMLVLRYGCVTHLNEVNVTKIVEE